jgi:hypothetical protein
MSDRCEEVFAGERLLHQKRATMRRRQLLAPVAADKGERDAARFQGVGDAGDRLSGKMGIEKRAMHLLAVDGLKRIAHTPGRANHDDARLLQHARNIEGYEEFVFDDEDAFYCHAFYCASAGQARIMLGGETDLISAFDQAPWPVVLQTEPALAGSVQFPDLEAEACPPDVICEQMEAAPLVGGKTRE